MPNPFKFTARELDTETGLYYYRARYYDQITGRFLSEDPFQSLSGTNFYAFVGNNPVGRTDPLGLDWLNNLGDFSAGAGSVLTFGLTDYINSYTGLVNKCSGWHTLGSIAGVALSTAIGGAAGAEAAEADAGKAGYEFSHWIPSRMGGPRSIFNGNYVSEQLHYLTDPFRYPSGWQDWGPKLNPAAQQLLRVPWVYVGGAAGAGYGGASAALGGSCRGTPNGSKGCN